MAKVAMKKIELLAPLEQSKSIVDYLQRQGAVELCDEPVEHEKMYKLTTSTSVTQFEKFLQTALNAQAVLDKYAPVQKSLIETFSARKELEVKDYLSLVDETDNVLQICSDIISLSKDIDECSAAIIRSQTLIDALIPWKDFDLPLKTEGTASTRMFIGTFSEEYSEQSLLEALAGLMPEEDCIAAEIISASKIQTCAFVVCHNSCAEQTEQALRQLNFVRISENSKHTPSQKIEINKADITSREKEIEKSKEKIAELGQYRDKIEFLIDYTTIRKEKYEAITKLSLSNNIFVLSGFIPEPKVKPLTEELERDYITAITISSPDGDDEPPTLLKNNAFAAPVETITDMYSVPSNNDIDPNPIMAFFYYLFFGLMLSDAGYGLLMVIGTLIAKKKIHLEEKMKRTVNMFMYCGISTVFWGAMFGSWFGDIVSVIFTEFLHKPAPRLYIWLEPVNDPMTLLLFCFLFGIIHLFVGIGIRFYQLWKDGKRIDAICDCVFVWLLIIGVAPIGAGLVVDTIPQWISGAAKYFIIIGVAGIVLTSGRSAKNILGKLGGGLYGLYNTASGYLGDILSYSRLLALGLSTGVIASVFNMLGVLVSNPVAKAISLTIIFVIGHSVNLAINLIGAYVHTNRLQYVEFFSKFYEGGGRSFTPLSVNTKYYKFKEEINNG